MEIVAMRMAHDVGCWNQSSKFRANMPIFPLYSSTSRADALESWMERVLSCQSPAAFDCGVECGWPAQ